jgi:cytosolic carboxypeptidase protein 6
MFAKNLNFFLCKCSSYVTMSVHKYFSVFFLFILLILISSCRTTDPEPFTGYDYDPEGVTETEDREIDLQHKRTIGFLSDGVWISNEFTGARASDIYRVDEHHYKIIIQPEIYPVNNSPWYGFKIWSRDSTRVTLELSYPEGRQRYVPKISNNAGTNWKIISSDFYRVDSSTGNGFIELDISADTLKVSAQETFTTEHLAGWLESMSNHSFVHQTVAGYTHQGRPLPFLKISKNSNEPVKGVIIIYNRQHPPEIPGYITGLKFLETIAGDSGLAQKFRTYFEVWAFPMMNPDGVDNGHWRTNAAGVDLNRDWEYFRQPETAAVQETLLPLKTRKDRKVFYGIDFHSTGRSLFYPIIKEIETFPLHFTYNWADKIIEDMPGLELSVEPFDITSPIAKNWTHKTFGADAVTFEVWDELPRDKAEKLGARSAELFMELMIEEYENAFKKN